MKGILSPQSLRTAAFQLCLWSPRPGSHRTSRSARWVCQVYLHGGSAQTHPPSHLREASRSSCPRQTVGTSVVPVLEEAVGDSDEDQTGLLGEDPARAWRHALGAGVRGAPTWARCLPCQLMTRVPGYRACQAVLPFQIRGENAVSASKSPLKRCAAFTAAGRWQRPRPSHPTLQCV